MGRLFFLPTPDAPLTPHRAGGLPDAGVLAPPVHSSRTFGPRPGGRPARL